jgi:phage shock protein PspC (stress-responsive transcriptional regulator)
MLKLGTCKIGAGDREGGMMSNETMDNRTERTQRTLPKWMDASEQSHLNGVESDTMNTKRMLYRHPTDKVIGGVCSGIAEYFGWDPVLVRVLWVVATFATWGGGLLAYILLSVFLPTGNNSVGQLRAPVLELSGKGVTWAAGALMGLGVLWLLANVGILPGLWGAFWMVVGVLFWPAVLIGAGYLLLRSNSKHDIDQEMANAARRVKESVNGAVPSNDEWKAGLNRVRSGMPLQRSRTNRMIVGVCGGMGEKFGIDANLIRLIWVAFAVGTMGFGALIYAGVAVLMPETQPQNVDERIQEIQVVDRPANRAN